MRRNPPIRENLCGTKSTSDSEPISQTGEQLWYGNEDEYAGDISGGSEEQEPKKCISVGDVLPYGIRLYYGFNNVFRLKDIGVKSRMLLVGVIGSFTPLCWNHHFIKVLSNFRYYEERGIEYICCVSTNDAFVQAAWSTFLGCYEKVLMIGDTSKAFTKALGMDIVVPFLDNSIRSKRYVIYVEDMVVTKMIMSPEDGCPKEWFCEHIPNQTNSDTEESEELDSDSSNLNAWLKMN